MAPMLDPTSGLSQTKFQCFTQSFCPLHGSYAAMQCCCLRWPHLWSGILFGRLHLPKSAPTNGPLNHLMQSCDELSLFIEMLSMFVTDWLCCLCHNLSKLLDDDRQHAALLQHEMTLAELAVVWQLKMASISRSGCWGAGIAC